MDKVNILVVDDRPEGLLAVEAVLTSPEYRLIKASSGQEALRFLLQYDFAVILLDVQMPLMNGFETASIIKTREKSKDIPIIFMSAINQDEQYVYQGYNVGAVDYLLKPFDPYILRSKVAIFVDLFVKNRLIQDQAQKIHENEIKVYAQALDRLELESLRKYQYLADAIPQIVLRLLPDASAEYFNKLWFDYSGLNLTQSAGLNWQMAIHNEDLVTFLSLFNTCTTHFSCECRIKGVDGKFRWHLLRMEPEFYSEMAQVNSWLGTATDIEQTKRNEETQRFLSEAGEVLVSSLDAHSLLKKIAELSVQRLGDWCSFDFFEEDELVPLVFHHKDPQKAIEGRKGVEGHFSIFDLVPIRTIGTEAPFFKVGSTLCVPLACNGKIFGVMTIGSDDSARDFADHDIKLAQELAQRTGMAYENSRLYKLSQDAIELRNDFLSIASHELNTPITSLKLQLQIVQKIMSGGIKEEQVLTRFANSIGASIRQVDRLIGLVQVLLDVSRIQSGQFSFNFKEVLVHELVNEVIDRNQEMLSNGSCTLTITSLTQACVNWDKMRIEQVITNLLTNAVKYAPGPIELSLVEEHDQLVLSIRDHGDGIPEDKLRKIFERFERATNSETVGGLGLGLFIVKQIVEGHNGHIEVRSAPDYGTCFTVTLPYDASARVSLATKPEPLSQSLS